MIFNKAKLSEPFIGCEAEFNEADIVLFGAPFDGTTSYRPGARFGGKAIRAESYGLETYSPYLDKDLTDLKVFDGGELELPFGNTEKVLNLIYQAEKEILSDNKFPFMLGGEHLVTLPAVKACLEKHPNLCIIHFDAHTDLREEYLGEKLSHACVMRRCWELLEAGNNFNEPRIYSYGIRSGTREEFLWAKSNIYLKKFDIPLHDLIEKAKLLKNKPVYFSIDIDVLDQSVFPATGTPEAGGINYKELTDAVNTIFENFNVVAADLTEYSPPYDLNGACAGAAGKLLREALLQVKKF